MEYTNFGYKKISSSDKESLVHSVFSKVASHYDIMNDIMSLGMHRIWKNQFIKTLNPQDNTTLIDVAGGTGDIAFRFLEKTQNSTVTVCDINSQMLSEGKKRSIDKNILTNISWLCGNAEKLPCSSNSFDYYTIAFGIRNVTNIDNALLEAFRVLKPGGRFLCLEFSHVTEPVMSKLYDLYSFNIIPHIGKFVANSKESYDYLVESIRMFPKQEEFKEKIIHAGFSNVSYTNLNLGIVAIHSGWRI